MHVEVGHQPAVVRLHELAAQHPPGPTRVGGAGTPSEDVGFNRGAELVAQQRKAVNEALVTRHQGERRERGVGGLHEIKGAEAPQGPPIVPGTGRWGGMAPAS